MDKLSIIIPVYNAEKTLKRCVESVLKQSYEDFELILVDDGSTDSSPELCDSFSDNRIVVFHIPNSGPGAARNYGIRRTTGRYLTFIDSDDTIGKDTYLTCIGAMKQNDCQMSIYPWSYVYPDKENSSRLGYQGRVDSTEIRQKIIYEDISGGGGYPWCRVIDCSSITKVPEFPENIKAYEDKVWVYEMLKDMTSVFFLSNPGYQYYMNENSLSRTLHIGNAADQLEAIEYMYNDENMFGGGSDLTFEGNVTNKIVSIFFYYKNVKEQHQLLELWHRYRSIFPGKPSSAKCRVKDILLKQKFSREF